ncbi:Gfo/Idh/MocA family protein [Shimia biformata]|uniref:Gfo/Idh/MocA family protein n=1 Tax=Shimia biformata TaxID=1294299 RepID=UPI0019512E7E|nr:Gfo/Idh/MocA family oxidoreductase [Shimia biformata]
MTDHVRWGILGASNFALQHMGPAIHAARGGALEALATSSLDKARGFADLVPGLRVHLDYDDMLNDPLIDAVYIPLPNHLHVEWSLKAIAAGKHVLCEKPMTLKADEFDRLIDARDTSGVQVAEAFMIVHHPQWLRAKEMFLDGAIGELTHVEGFFCYHNDDGKNIRNRPETGGGGIRDIGVYTYGATRFLTGKEPTEITHANVRCENGVDVFADISAQFDGFTARWLTSTRLQPWQEMRFHGSEGILRLTAPFNANVFDIAEVELHQTKMGRRIERFPADNHYVHQVERFNRSVSQGRPFPNTLEFSKGTQAVIDAVFEKAGLE